MKPRFLLHPITERKSDICAALSSSARSPNNHLLYWNLPPPRKRVWSNSSKNSPLSIMYIRVVSRANNFPRLLLFEKMHQPRRKLLIRLHDFHRGISKARRAVERPQENNSWRLTVTDRGGNWFTGVFLPGKIPPRRDTTLRWPGRGMRLIRPPRVLLPRKITAAHPPPLILEITFPGIPPPALFFPMVAGYFSGGQRSRDIVRYLSGWSWVDRRDGRPLGSRILTCTSTITIFDNVSKNRKIFVFAHVWFKFERET